MWVLQWLPEPKAMAAAAAAAATTVTAAAMAAAAMAAAGAGRGLLSGACAALLYRCYRAAGGKLVVRV